MLVVRIRHGLVYCITIAVGAAAGIVVHTPVLLH
jgi:hypothetical protein